MAVAAANAVLYTCVQLERGSVPLASGALVTELAQRCPREGGLDKGGGLGVGKEGLGASEDSCHDAVAHAANGKLNGV